MAKHIKLAHIIMERYLVITFAKRKVHIDKSVPLPYKPTCVYVLRYIPTYMYMYFVLSDCLYMVVYSCEHTCVLLCHLNRMCDVHVVDKQCTPPLPSSSPASGASQVMDVVETMQRLEKLRDRREELAERERELDEQHHRMQQCLRNITDDTINEQYPSMLCFMLRGYNYERCTLIAASIICNMCTFYMYMLNAEFEFTSLSG